ncbi:MAG: tRNA (N6-isopentenyl adenosine(37)-C2)-methylthiotransferase MiaB [Deltaproteobacteria bacterium]|nr:tRNA (N6-isopentenyl adenosine(37)-C2)-methylthiotransferase MiaB [Deltaproteobacteria bacterium]
MRRFYIKTYGCQMNEHDSRKIAGLLAVRGLQPTDAMADADLILFNTCTIREKAEHKAMSEIGRAAELKAARPELVVGVCGCVAQQEKELLFDRFPLLDLLFGPDQIPALPRLLDALEQERRHVSALEIVNDVDEYQFLNLTPWADGVVSPAAAFVTIMKGCDSNCAYCIVPQVRGREVCRPADDIVSEVQGLVERGVREVTLLGQTVNTYGNRRHAGVIPFAALLQRIAVETAIQRIRFTSPHPKDVNDSLLAAYRDNAKLCRHIHLPVQSGADVVLRRMRRAYTRAQYLEKVAALRGAAPDLAITTDMIVGFPGETDADFAETLSLVETVQFDGLFAFKYSPRPGTESFARLPDDVPPATKDERLQRLFALNEAIVTRRYAAHIGTTRDVLIESRDEGDGRWRGRTTHHMIVHFIGTECVLGDIVPVHITDAGGYSLRGEKR